MTPFLIVLGLLVVFCAGAWAAGDWVSSPDKKPSDHPSTEKDKDGLVDVRMPTGVRAYVRFLFVINLIGFTLIALLFLSLVLSSDYSTTDEIFGVLLLLLLYGLQTWALYWASGYKKPR